MTRAWRVVTSGLCALLATIGLGGDLVAQPPSPSLEPSVSVAVADARLFPSAEEVGGVLGVDVETSGIEGGLSQAWEGSDFHSEVLPSAQMAVYASTPDEAGPLVGVVIDIARFESGADALQHTRETMFGDEAVTEPAFETELAGDLVWTMSFPAADSGADSIGGSVITFVAGPVAIVVVAVASDVPEMEAESEAIVALILDRLAVEQDHG